MLPVVETVPMGNTPRHRARPGLAKENPMGIGVGTLLLIILLILLLT
jgi:hypothetical protein